MKDNVLSTLALSLVGMLCGTQQASATHTVTVETLAQFVAAFNAHNMDAVMSFFADDCELLMPR